VCVFLFLAAGHVLFCASLLGLAAHGALCVCGMWASTLDEIVRSEIEFSAPGCWGCGGSGRRRFSAPVSREIYQ